MEEGIIGKKYEPIPKADKATADSDTVIKMKIADRQMVDKKGISFYCSKRHEYIFIENSKGQSIHHAPRIMVQDITSKELLKEWQEQD